MKIKKFLATATVCAALAGLLALSASAHGGHHRRSTQTYYPTCTVENCTQAGTHLHDGVNYCGHAAGGCTGHGYGHRGGHC